MAKRKKPPEPAMTDAEVERFNREWEAIPVAIRIARSRALNVQYCLEFRKLIKDGPITLEDGTCLSVEATTIMLRRSQKKLLKLRIWRATGHYPSSDN
jgi:hypothetical protein